MSSQYIVWKCLQCHCDLNTSSTNAGQSLRCPECKTLQVVPAKSGDAPSDISFGQKLLEGIAQNWRDYQGHNRG